MDNQFFEEGLAHKEWNDVLDRYLSGGSLDSDEYERMNSYQATVIQEIKKSIKRLKQHDEGNS